MSALLARAGTALDEGDWNEALTALREAWRSCRAVALEEAVFALSEWIDTGLAPLPEHDWQDEWDQLARIGRPIDLGRLLTRVGALPAGRISGRVEAITRFGPDPRTGRTFLAMIDNPPTTSSSNFSVWTSLFAHLPSCVDTRAKSFLDEKARKSGGSSGFWKKLQKWSATARDGLQPAPDLPAADRAQLRALRDRIEALAASGPPVVAPLEDPVQDAVSDLPGLGHALAALEARELGTALDGLVGFWAEHRTAEVADLIDRLDALVEARPPVAKSSKAMHALWMERAAAPRPSEVAGLLAVAAKGSVAQREQRLEPMISWSPDPRVSRFAESHFPDYMLGARKRLWAAVMDILTHHADPRRREAFAEREARHQEPGPLHRYSEIRRNIRRTAPSFYAALDGGVSVSATDGETLANLTRAIEKLESGDQASEASLHAQERALVDAILARPDVDAPREVYADWLLEQGDRRGEFLQLDCRLAAGERVRGKRDKALKKHSNAIHGPLAPVIARSVEFDRGLMVAAFLTGRKLGVLSTGERDALCTDLRWTHVRKLGMDSAPGLDAVFARAPLRSLHTLEGVDFEALAGFARRTDTLPLRVLDLRAGTERPDADWAVLDTLADRFPLLEEVHVMAWTRHADRGIPPRGFFASPLLRKVRRLSNGRPGTATGGHTAIGQWLNLMSATRCPVEELHAEGPNLRGVATRTAEGRYALELELDGIRWPRQIEALTPLLRGIRGPWCEGLQVAWGENNEEGALSTLREALG